jgi:hypothetical protein
MDALEHALSHLVISAPGTEAGTTSMAIRATYSVDNESTKSALSGHELRDMQYLEKI